MKLSVWFSPFILLLGGCGSGPDQTPPLWAGIVEREVDALGIQSWIIVAESSFPVVSGLGVRTLVLDGEIPQIVDCIVNHLAKSETVTPSFNTALELSFVSNDRVPGIDYLREQHNEALHEHQVRQMDNRSLTLLAHSDASKYAIMVLKSKTALPSSSVFIELDSGYWDRESEDRLRQEMKAAEKRTPQQKIESNETNN